VTTVRMF